jgi:hypothetical protein
MDRRGYINSAATWPTASALARLARISLAASAQTGEHAGIA